MRTALTRLLLRAAGNPVLPPVAADGADAAAADQLLAGDASALDRAGLPRLDVLRWLGEHREVLFHGSGRGDVEMLEPIRLSKDAREFGNREAVFATDDPVWALWFAILRRDDGFRSTRNASLSVAGDAGPSRRYVFAVNRGALAGHRFGPGFVYLLPKATFEREPPLLGVLDTAQWVSAEAVRPLVRVEVTPADFPFLDRVVEHGRREPMLVTILRFGRFRRLFVPRRR